MREDWVECKIGEIGEYFRGVTYKKEQSSNVQLDNYLPILRGNNIQDQKIDFNELVFVQENLINENQLLKKNDILFAMSSGSLHLVGKSALIQQNFNYSFGAFCGVFRPDNIVNAKFLSFYFSSNNFRNYISKSSKGSNINNLKKEHILENITQLPPLPEQRAIVKKIEALFSSLDAGIADLKKAQEQLKIYRQAVLKKAFEGEFLSIARNIQYNSIEDVLKIVSGNTPNGLKNIANEGYIPFYKVSDMNLVGNEIYLSNSNIYLTEKEIKDLKIKLFPKGTIVFPKRGGAILTNKKRILSQDSTFDLNLMGIIPNDLYVSKFIYYYFLSIDLATIMDGSAVPQINNKNINPLLIGKFTLEEQAQIVKEIEARLSVCDAVQQQIKDSLSQAEALHQSILKKAFEGKLLTEEDIRACQQAPDYEPASVLLEKIKAEKEANKTVKKTKKK